MAKEEWFEDRGDRWVVDEGYLWLGKLDFQYEWADSLQE
jgi:hypothetical protein